jgi:hypothetical protein
MNFKRFINKNKFFVFIVLAAVILFIAYKNATEGFQQTPPSLAYIPIEPDCKRGRNNKMECTCPKDYKYDSKTKACLAFLCPISGKSGNKQLRPVPVNGVCNTEFSVEV